MAVALSHFIVLEHSPYVSELGSIGFLQLTVPVLSKDSVKVMHSAGRLTVQELEEGLLLGTAMSAHVPDTHTRMESLDVSRTHFIWDYKFK